MSVVFLMIDANGNKIVKGDKILVGYGEEFDRFTFRCLDTESNLAFVQPLRKCSMTIQALPKLIYKEEL